MSKSENKVTRFENNPFYFVTCEELSLGRRDEEVVEKVLQGGIKLIQLRDKLASPKKIFKKAERLRKLTNSYDALLIINDHLDVALSVKADGVHLGQDDLPLSEAQGLVATYARQDDFFKDFLIGISTHNLAEVNEAVISIDKMTGLNQGAGYYNIGPIYDTSTKVNNYPPLGVEGLKEIVQFVKEKNISKKIPFSVMGGIKIDHLTKLLKQFIHPIAMVTEICQQPNIKAFLKSLMLDYGQHLKTKEYQKELTINN